MIVMLGLVPSICRALDRSSGQARARDNYWNKRAGYGKRTHEFLRLQECPRPIDAEHSPPGLQILGTRPRMTFGVRTWRSADLRRYVITSTAPAPLRCQARRAGCRSS